MIVRTLRIGNLDDATFEKIAVRIAKQHGLPVLPMPGGREAGYDGAIVDADGGRLPGPLVATMQDNGVANIRKNLKRHSRTYRKAEKTAFFVTTRPKTNPQKQNLTKEAKKLGVRPARHRGRVGGARVSRLRSELLQRTPRLSRSAVGALASTTATAPALGPRAGRARERSRSPAASHSRHPARRNPRGRENQSVESNVGGTKGHGDWAPD